jgi:hypothetical protein
VVTVAVLAGVLLAGVVAVSIALVRRGHDELRPSVEAFADFRAALARSDAPPARR